MQRAAVPLFLALAGLTAGCPSRPPGDATPPALPGRETPAPIVVSADPWVLATDRWSADSRGAYLANGLLGQRIPQGGAPRAGEAAEGGFAAGVYHRESLVTLPALLPLKVESPARTWGAEAAHARRYRQEMRLREAVLVTEATWDSGAGEVDLRLEAALLYPHPDTAVLRATVHNRGREAVTVSAPPPGLDTAQPALWSAGNPLVVRESRDYGGRRLTFHRTLASLDAASPVGRSEGGDFTASVAPGAKAEVALVTRVEGLLAAPGPSLERVDAAVITGWLEAHRRAWERRWAGDIEIEGDAEAQQAVRACLYQVLASVRPEVSAGVPPMGLSGTAFSGHVFWDMDSWVLPAVLPQHPELARAMLEYRLRTLPGARENARAEGLPGAAFAWESAATGRETLLTDVFRHGRHVSGDVALAAKQYFAATGDRAWLARFWPVLEATAQNWAARAKPDGKGGFVVRGVTTPDETAGQVDHSAWTHHVARVNLRFAAEAARLLGRRADPRWETVAAGLGYLRDPETKLILPYAGFKAKTKAKQADVLLLVHPGEEGLPDEELGRMYDQYAPRVIANGPAMTDAIHAIVAARLGRGEEALTRFQAAYRPFVRPPFMLFSEKRTRDNLVFLTGAAGVVEAVVYGFAGLRPEADPAAPRRPGLEPHLPPGWTALRLRGLAWQGKRWDVEVRPGAAPAWIEMSGEAAIERDATTRARGGGGR